MDTNRNPIQRILEISIPALIGLAVAWGVFTTRISATEKEIVDLKTTYGTLLDMKVDIGKIQTDINYIKQELNNKL